MKFSLNRDATSIWSDPLLATAVAAIAISLLLVSAWLLRRSSRQGRGAASVCLIVSAILHLALVFLLPHLKILGGGSSNRGISDDAAGDKDLVFATFDPGAAPAASAAAGEESALHPLPLPTALPDTDREPPPPTSGQPAAAPIASGAEKLRLPQSLQAAVNPDVAGQTAAINDLLDSWLSDDEDPIAVPETATPRGNMAEVIKKNQVEQTRPVNAAAAAPAHVPGVTLSDFANRSGDAKRLALLQNGGDESTEAAVEAALRFLAADQRPDGSWDPLTSGAGRETMTLGTDRKSAGRKATTGISGLALMSMLGAGSTHRSGPYAENVRRGLTYLILNQKPDGSLAGEADVYEANYCHGMAALAMCEAAAMTGDASAMECAAAAVRYTMAIQHSVTGGWRYVRGDPGDLSQLGWQAMVLDAGRTAGVPTRDQSFLLTARFVRSVRAGQQGGLAAYRPGEGPTRTMTAEALATRLLLGEQVPPAEIKEAEDYLLRQLPGTGRDNYYGWYYTSLALHQLQDDAWETWNTAMKKHLIARQGAGGSWPTDSEWGGYGGRVYTTAMGALCLEVYYRHLRRSAAVATR